MGVNPNCQLLRCDPTAARNNATVGLGSVINDVQNAYNTFSQLITQYQSHSGAVNVGLTPSVQYGYANGSANTTRPTSITYPNARVINLDYGTAGAMNDQLSRIGSLIDGGTTHLADYTFVGFNRTVQVNSTQPGIELTYIKQGSEPIGDGGDQYTGWDRFTRVIDQRWLLTSSGAALERIQYGFDRANNRLYRANMVASGGQDEYYTYDNVYQLLTLQRGTLNAGRTGISGTPTWEEDFTFDPTANWNQYVNKVSGATTLNQGRTHNTANEITAISGSSTYIGQNKAGNIVLAPQTTNWLASTSMVYDAWNRLVSATNNPSGSSSSSSSASATGFAYDGLNRRVTKTTGSIRHYYYSDPWQILEERVGSATTADRQFVWGLRYSDDLVLRDVGAQRFYAMHDYFNCTAIVDTSGTVQERYGYNAFGQVRFMTAAFGSRSSSSYGWEILYGAYRWDSETGFYQIRNRYLHPTLGRWLTRDPLDYQGLLNLYVYATNRAVSQVDPSGLKEVPNLKLYIYNPTPKSVPKAQGICAASWEIQWWLVDRYPAPALGINGGVIQDITIEWDLTNCDGTPATLPNDPKFAGKKAQDKVHYYEEFRIQGNQNNALESDTFAFNWQSICRGTVTFTGKARLFVVPPGKTLESILSVHGWSNNGAIWSNGYISTVDQTDPLTYLGDLVYSPSVDHVLSFSWDCCPRGTKKPADIKSQIPAPSA